MRGRPANIPEIIVETATVKLVREAAQYSLDLRFPVRLIGKPGTGKSSALWHIAQDFGGVYCEISQQSKAPKGMLELLLKEAGQLTRQKYIDELANEAYYYFRSGSRYNQKTGAYVEGPILLVVDEVQTLEVPAFRELLRIQEKCGIGLLLAGNAERLASTRKKEADTWAQIESRIAMTRQLPAPSRTDCDLIGSTYNVEGMDAYAGLAAYGAKTNFRDLVQLLETAKRLTGGATGIRLAHLKSALGILTTKPDLLRLMQPEAA
ncbi:MULTISPECIES: ATP-binding protein [unclassified Agrobacterium]|uniref:ATP-binding protein n=1 Tax=unclassified Agrobacterium TaxID=2632611 RepID=UPI00244B848F|nr:MULTISPECIES: ATP-binding protein [unclassified Agrobacterium]MDH0614219.1 ATP-binding protein [Agrobacterium sp. GD03872]MDH0695486.1 ATP-binding protein [Agrobacterium sp. GD03871]MDH1058388.1 ATP-binding protein [Agrobacterium sp. GD03992]MDH2209670.1 ATP-binding protein [Agrobacterium sp. GD03643]MDH2219074.1 ATP-binding protein [Agrobacterium sp. GD03638]